MSTNKKVQGAKETPNKSTKTSRPLREKNADTSGSKSGSMSEGGLSNNENGRERTRLTHSKSTVMGSDDDGQAG